MPFQGNPNAGAPDTALLQFLFSRQDERRRAERQQQLDQATAQTNLAKMIRERELHTLEVQKRTLSNTKLEGDIADARRSAGEDTATNIGDQFSAASSSLPGAIAAQGFPQQNFSAAFQDPSLQADFPGLPGKPTKNFAEIIADQGPAAAQDAFSATPKQVKETEDSVFNAFDRSVDRLAKRRGISTEQQLSDLESQLGATEIRREREFNDKAGADTRKDIFREKKIIGLRRKSESGQLSSREQEEAEASLSFLVKSRNAELTRNQPEFTDRMRREFAEVADGYQARIDMIDVLQGIKARPGTRGPGGALTSTLRNIIGLSKNINELIAPSVREQIDNPRNSTEVQQRLESIFVFGIDPDTTKLIPAARFAAVQAKWLMLISELSKNGRVTNFQLKDVEGPLKFIGPFVSTDISDDRLDAAINVFTRGLSRKRNRLRVINPDVRFRKNGTIEGFEETPRIGITQPVTDQLRPGPVRGPLTPVPDPERGAQQTGSALEKLGSNPSNAEALRALRADVGAGP